MKLDAGLLSLAYIFLNAVAHDIRPIAVGSGPQDLSGQRTSMALLCVQHGTIHKRVLPPLNGVEVEDDRIGGLASCTAACSAGVYDAL